MREPALFRLLIASAASAALFLACKGDPPMPAGTGEIPVRADDKGFTPSSVKVPKGSTAALVFTRTSDDTCATEVVFPELNIKKELPKGTSVRIDIPTDKEQRLTFQCGMGMYKSAVVVAAN